MKSTLDKELRLTEQNRLQDELLRRAAKRSPVNFSRNRFGPLMFFAAFGIAGLYFATLSFASPTTGPDRVVNLSMEPSARQVASGELLTVRIWADSLDKPMSAVDAQLAYPADRFDLVGFDGSASRFAIDTASRGDAGLVVLSRAVAPAEVQSGLIGRQFVGKAVFRAKQTAGPAGMRFTESSKIIRADSGVDILERTSGGDYTISSR